MTFTPCCQGSSYVFRNIEEQLNDLNFSPLDSDTLLHGHCLRHHRYTLQRYKSSQAEMPTTRSRSRTFVVGILEVEFLVFAKTTRSWLENPMFHFAVYFQFWAILIIGLKDHACMK